MNSLIIRTYADDDHDQVVALWRGVFSEDPGHNAPEAMIERKRRVQRELFLVGEHYGRIVAAAMGGYDGVRGWIYHLAVAESERRHGFASLMMHDLEQRLAALGCIKINLQIRAGNDAVAAFYQSLGYSTEARISMGKRL